MNPGTFLTTAWTWNLPLALGLGLTLIAFFGWARRAGGGGRIGIFGSALLVIFLALCSPLAALANGLLFSAHMVQHLLLLVIAPALVLLSLPATVRAPAWLRPRFWAAAGWAGGVGAMWLWHVPALCNAAASGGPVHAAQSASLVSMGLLFWWPILAPAASDRISPWAGVGYLFAACLACTALGIVITLTSVELCPIFQAPVDPLGLLPVVRHDWGLSAERDRQLGGLLMWVPMCALYLGAIFLEIARWYAEDPLPRGEGAA
jgi:cytochrome c oxidase assembly factor CtaG